MTRAYYNENNDAAADWLENLIAAGLIAPGFVDRRSITEVQADDLSGYTQHHFFAGIGGWSAALRLAGWPDERPVWTASCPCQPFSVAGKGAGTDDLRHLWPDLFRLWRAFRPAVGVGEQVAGKAGYGWFDGVRANLAHEGYASRAVDIPALAVDAPHERNRLYWVAIAMADADDCRRDGRTQAPEWRSQRRDVAQRVDERAVANCDGVGCQKAFGKPGNCSQPDCEVATNRTERGHGIDSGACDSFWADHDWIVCHDGKARRVADARAPLLVDGVRGRVAVSRPDELCPTAHPDETRWVSRIAAWSGFGNAIVPPLAAQVVAALMEEVDHA